MKNRFKKLAAILGIAAMITSQSGVIPVQAEEGTSALAASTIQPAEQITWGSDYNVTFKNPNGSNSDVGFSGILTRPDNTEIQYGSYSQTTDGGLFYTSEEITDGGTYTFTVRTHDKSQNWKIIDETEVSKTYTKPGKQLSTPQELSWDEKGILIFKEVEDAASYGFRVYDSAGNPVTGSFGSNMLGSFMIRKNGYVNINFNKFVAMRWNTSIGNGYTLEVRATSNDLNTISHGDWITSVFKSNHPDASSAKKEERASQKKACTHEYEWETERDATDISNGEEVYRCKYCGDIKERMEMPNSAYAKFNKDAIRAIDKAPVNGTVTLKTDMWVSFYAAVIDTLKSRPDVTVVLNYFYKGTRYTMTIPAGADLSALEASDGYYGFRYLDAFFPGQEIK